MVARYSLFSLALLLAASVPVHSSAAPQKPLAVCVDNKSGAASAKTKCNPKKETRFVPADTQTLGGSGLNVYDATGRAIGPWLSFGQTIVEINGAKYAATFQRDSIGITQPYLFFPEPNCGGAPFIRSEDLSREHFSGVGTLLLYNYGTQLLATSGSIPEARYQSYEKRVAGGQLECVTAGLPNYPSPFAFGLPVTDVGPMTSVFPPPFDVR